MQRKRRMSNRSEGKSTHGKEKWQEWELINLWSILATTSYRYHYKRLPTRCQIHPSSTILHPQLTLPSIIKLMNNKSWWCRILQLGSKTMLPCPLSWPKSLLICSLAWPKSEILSYHTKARLSPKQTWKFKKAALSIQYLREEIHRSEIFDHFDGI